MLATDKEKALAKKIAAEQKRAGKVCKPQHNDCTVQGALCFGQVINPKQTK